MEGNKNYTLHVIMGTHWDREWRFTAEQSKLKLSDLVNDMLDTMERKPSFQSFCLDGGMVVIEDYLAVHPENKNRLKKLGEQHRLMMVGWYTLPDMFIVAPETLVRNMLLGRQMAEQFGGAMKSGYTAFSYGQISQLPQIYQGFGINTAMFYRGTNTLELPPLFLWEGKDGSRLYTVRTFDDTTRQNWYYYPYYYLVHHKEFIDLTYHYDKKQLPVHLCDESMYERPFKLLKEVHYFNQDKEHLKKAVELIRNQALPHAIKNHILGLNIDDNAWAFEQMPEMINALNEISPDIKIVQSTFDEYFEQTLKDTQNDDLFVYKGELRLTGIAPGFTGLYGGSQSSRVKLKLLNDEAETWLLNYAEPIASAAALLGFEYPSTMLARAWKYLLQNHAHDSICGASVDWAHEDMLYRFSVAKSIGEEITARGIMSLYTRIDTKTNFNDSDFIITLFNTLPLPQKKVVPVVLDVPSISDGLSPIDPCTGLSRQDNEMKYFDIVDAEGSKIEYEILDRATIWLGVESELDDDAIELRTVRRRVLIYAEIPAMGYATYALRPREPRYIEHPQPCPDRKLIARGNGTLENEHLLVTINPNGTFNLFHKASNRLFENMHYLTDFGETGSAHKSNAPHHNPVVTSYGCRAKISMDETSVLRGVYRIDINLEIPANATNNYADRSFETVRLPITSWLTLDGGAEYLKIKTRVNNRARDHKLQVNFPTGIKTDYVAVESAFAVEKRNICWKDTADNSEACSMFQPMQNFVDVSDGKEGLAFLSRGLREYEVQDDDDRTLAITLLRTQRAYMKANNAYMTPRELAKYTGMHSFGELEFEYALYPHVGDWEEGHVLQQTYQHKVDIKAILGVPNEGHLPDTASFISLEPEDKLMVSAFKRSEDKRGYILRVWNTSAEKVDAVINTILPVKSISKLRLDETPLEKLHIRSGKFSFEIGPHKIETILLTC